nr:putative nuclease HARBI1 [Tanacetum cinerariifolium]
MPIEETKKSKLIYAPGIDVIDEATAKMKLEITLKPTASDETDHLVLQLQMEGFGRAYALQQEIALKYSLKRNNGKNVSSFESPSPGTDCTGRVGLLPIHEVYFRISSNGIRRISANDATTARDSLVAFCMTGRELYGNEYLRKPIYIDIETLYAFHKSKHEFYVLMGSIDYPLILLKSIASQELWIWHAFFGVAGSNNDVNIIRQSIIFNDLKFGKAPDVQFVAKDVTYNMGYYLTDGIYVEWFVLMKSISNPGVNDTKRIIYKNTHEAARKDVERAFDVLKEK